MGSKECYYAEIYFRIIARITKIRASATLCFFQPGLTAKAPRNRRNRGIMALPLGVVQLTVVACITTAMAVFATMLRLWSRYLQSHNLVIHDYLALAGMVFTAGTVSVYLAGET